MAREALATERQLVLPPPWSTLMSDLLKYEPGNTYLLTKLEAVRPLSVSERAALYDLPIRVREYRGDEDIVLEGDRPTECCLVLDGLVCRYTIVPGGGRQILALHVPGEMPDLQSLHLARMDHSLAALSRTRAAFIPHESMRALLHSSPTIADLFWRETLVECAVSREWVVGMGRRSAYARLAHLFCELATKMDYALVSRGGQYPLPLTQTQMGDALGLSTVHVNRSLQALRKAGAIEVRAQKFRVLDWKTLIEAGEFDPGYLHLPAVTRASVSPIRSRVVDDLVMQNSRAAVGSSGLGGGAEAAP